MPASPAGRSGHGSPCRRTSRASRREPAACGQQGGAEASSFLGTRLGLLFSYTVVIETVFGWPGLGTLLLTASQSRDRPVLLGLVLLVSISVIVANLAIDLVYAWIDPRIRYD